jgi:hypothetical protein
MAMLGCGGNMKFQTAQISVQILAPEQVDGTNGERSFAGA